MTNPHVAFRSSDTLHTRTDGFISRMQGGATKPEPREIEAIMAIFMEEALQAFMVRAAEATGLSPSLFKVVNMTCQTINKATSLVIGRSAKKMDLAQNKAAADYMDSVRQQGSDGWYVAFPVSEGMAIKGSNLPSLCANGDYDEARRELEEYLHAITDESIKWYFEKPMDLLGFGPVLRKLASVGVETTRKASRSLIRNLIPKLDDDQLTSACGYQADMLMRFEDRKH
ncbi:MAG: hypothetical protein VX379_04930 [Pseudomonadota bacterium]|uniref:hypothetical protein n=1 Tax=Alcanivorax sp. TaxID=1872427 RepID=UPI00243A4ABA|nr:hypothetical protein [Alcanivorax sp.]MED5238902.1 hypothetical protein [Pseudomonadota bacterium]MEE3320035.1 hypothetical protein [Pseudomonadota bacterium]